jgi:perosamine synthetase
LIEDAAEAHGQTYKGKPCGSFGDVSIFSFYPNKLITTGEGGMVMTDNPELDEKLRYMRNLCFTAHKRFVHEDLGWNMRMTNVQAAIGLAQLERWEESIKRKREIGKLYTELLQDTKGITLPKTHTDYAENIYWVFGITTEKTGRKAEEFMKQLGDAKIGTRPFFYPMHLQPVLKRMGLFNNENCPVSENMYHYGFYLPSGLGITNEQIITVANTLKSLL